MTKVYTFTAVLLRDGEEKRFIPNSSTYDGFLAIGKSQKPRFNKTTFESSGLNIESLKTFKHVRDVIGTEYEPHLLRFGKQDGYWIWNKEATERKKVAKAKVVSFWTKSDPNDFDCEGDEQYLSKGRFDFSKEVWAIIEPNVRAEKWRHSTKYLLINPVQLRKDLERIGWTMKIR